MFNSVPIARTQRCEQFYQFLVLILNFAQIDELFDNSRRYLSFQQLLVVGEQLLHGALGEDIIFLVGLHGLREKEVYPLGGIHFIHFVATHCTLQENVGILAKPCNEILLTKSL